MAALAFDDAAPPPPAEDAGVELAVPGAGAQALVLPSASPAVMHGVVLDLISTMLPERLSDRDR